MSHHTRITVLTKKPTPVPAQRQAVKDFISKQLVILEEKARLAALKAQREKELLASAERYAQLKKEADQVVFKKIYYGEISYTDIQTQKETINQYIITHTQDQIVQYATYNTEVANAFLEATKPPPKPKHKHKSAGFWQKAFTIAKIVAIGVVATFAPPIAPAVFGTVGASIVGAGVACAATDAVCQQVGVGLDLQEKFSWNEVIESGIGAAAGSATAGGSMFAHVAGNSIGGAAAQGTEMALGLRDKFDLSAVAMQAGSAVVSSAVNELMPTVNETLNKTIPQAMDALGEANMSVITTSVANTTAQSALSSVIADTPMNLECMAINAVSSVLVNKWGKQDLQEGETKFDLNDSCLPNAGEFSLELPTQSQLEAFFETVNQAADRLDSLISVEQTDPMIQLNSPNLLESVNLGATLPNTAEINAFIASINAAMDGLSVVDGLGYHADIADTNLDHPSSNSSTVSDRVDYSVDEDHTIPPVIVTAQRNSDVLNVAEPSFYDSLSTWQKVGITTGVILGAVALLPEELGAALLMGLGRLGTALLPGVGPLSEALAVDSMAGEAVGTVAAGVTTTKAFEAGSQWLSKFSFFKRNTLEIPLEASPKLTEVSTDTVVTEDVFHTVRDRNHAEAILEEISWKALGKNNRFGQAFYLSEIPETSLAELTYRNLIGVNTIRFEFNAGTAKILDLTKPEIASEWGYMKGMEHIESQPIAIKAIEKGYNVIRYNSERGPGYNLAVLSEFTNLLTPKMIVSTPKSVASEALRISP